MLDVGMSHADMKVTSMTIHFSGRFCSTSAWKESLLNMDLATMLSLAGLGSPEAGDINRQATNAQDWVQKSVGEGRS